MGLPLLKLAFLLVRQASKPVAKYIAGRAREYRGFRDWICIPVAQRVHRWEVKAKMRSLNLGTKVTKVPPLSEARAVEQGSELLSEGLVYFIASFIVVYEYNRSGEKEQEKEEKLVAEKAAVRARVAELEERVERMMGRILDLATVAEGLEEERRREGEIKNLKEERRKREHESLEEGRRMEAGDKSAKTGTATSDEADANGEPATDKRTK